jgi:hypothetical protein
MAVVRPELTVQEVDWLVDTLEGHPTVNKRLLRELKRAQQRGHELEVHERTTTKRLRAEMAAKRDGQIKASQDEQALSAILQRMTDAGQLEGTGYTPDEVDDLAAAVKGLGVVEEPFTGEYPDA